MLYTTACLVRFRSSQFVVFVTISLVHVPRCHHVLLCLPPYSPAQPHLCVLSPSPICPLAAVYSCVSLSTLPHHLMCAFCRRVLQMAVIAALRKIGIFGCSCPPLPRGALRRRLTVCPVAIICMLCCHSKRTLLPPRTGFDTLAHKCRMTHRRLSCASSLSRICFAAPPDDSSLLCV